MEKQAIELLAEQAGMTVSAYLRHSAMNHQIKQRLSEHEIEMLQMLRVYRYSFTSLFDHVKNGNPDIKIILEQIISGIDQQLKKLQ